MRKFLLSLVFAISAIAVQAQEPAIVMTTTKSVNSQFSFGIDAVAPNTPIQIDWGNGVKENFTIGDVTEFFGFPLKGSSVKIWGEGIASLNVTSMELTALDVTRATSLTYLYIKTNQLTTLDLSNCTALTFVDCTENLLTSLNLPSTSTLVAVNCDNNLLTSLNVSGATGITELTCTNNKLTFATLPIKQPSWTTYTYSPQQNVTLPKQTYSTNEEIDLSSQLTIGINTTTYTWKTASGTTLVSGTDYNVTGGKFTFLKTYTESLYCEMANATFPSLTLKTTSISVLPTPSVIMTTTTAVGSSFSFGIGATTNNTPIQVDWGNGTLASYTVGTSQSSVSGTLAGNTIKIYGVFINSLSLSNSNLTSLNVTNCTALTYLLCTSNQLAALDVTNNSALTTLWCNFNRLTALDVTNNTALTSLICNSNELTALDVTNNTALASLSCGYNQLAALDVSNCSALINLSCEKNQIAALDVTNNIALTHIWCYNNKLTALNMSNNSALTKLYCSSNSLTALDVTNNAGLTELDCGFNYLTALDMTNNTALASFNCQLNKLIALDVTKNAALTSLFCNSNQLTTIDVTKNTALVEFSCSGNKLTALDVTNNTALTELYCSLNKLSTLDVSKNTALANFDCDNNQLTILDVTKNNALVEFSCSGNKLTVLDVTNNTALTELYCSSNNLSTLDVTKNTALTTLYCNSNQLTALDVTNNTALNKFSNNNNKFTFSTLPIKQATWTTYTYHPQAKFTLPKTEYALNEEVDLSSQLSVGGNITSYTWKTQSGNVLTKNKDYTEDNGIFRFQNPYLADSVFCEMTNASFPLLTLVTQNITFPPTTPVITLTSSNPVGSTFIFTIVCESRSGIKIDWGKGTIGTYLISNAIFTRELKDSVIKIYGVGIKLLNVSNNNITKLNTSNCESLKELYCYSNRLTALDVTNNTQLTTLSCGSNQLTALDVTKNTALTKLYCNSNQLTFSTLPINQTTWNIYNYSPQNAITLPKKQYGLTETLDLSSELTVNANTTNYVWKTKGGTTLNAGTDYNVTNGITTFLKVQADSVYCQITNATFPNLTLNTTNIKVTQFPLSVEDNGVSINVYPNPATENFTIKMAEEIVRVEVYTITGVKVFDNGLYSSTTVTVPLSSMPKGTLLIKAYTRKGVYSGKVVKI